ncbi:cyclopropane-fatty-acyl-phospholipid synthase family protein [Quisquiliibacterium transsilvanicum]|uniref:Cyclopropane-fatty-acyl-phospholipid synthase n=2 Tax=Quisquiliibacterium transsilvanicum TaxID=1549638 RepID=A0A7W8HIH2_9BURK|nr:cyclopropane-fatty-acyl-phospholipid synthase [Quisquiliibacterium transsilvanicum]
MSKTLDTGANLSRRGDDGLAAIGATPGAQRHDVTAKAKAGGKAAAMPAAARIVLRLLERLHTGSLSLVLPDGRTLRFGRGEPAASMRLSRWEAFGAALARGDIGFAESWIDGDWQTDSLADLLSLLIANRDALESAVYGTAAGRLLYRIRHLLRRNSRTGSRRNIHAHYDLGNDFYRLWLDPGMTYSSALFDGDAGRTLVQAQEAKYRRMLDELSLPAGASVLEIGCGWGAFAELAVADGLRVKGLTLSTEQLAWARDRLAATGAGRLASFELQDYRDERGRHDGIVSIEMFEAVGEAYWPRYFETVARTLAPGGRAVIQTITIDEALFDRYRRGTDFIQQYVFPGGMLPSVPAFEAAARRAGLRVLRRFAFGQDYARTLQLWREAFCARLPEVRAQGFDERFVRTWLFYLAYCEAAFRSGNTDVVQFTLERA